MHFTFVCVGKLKEAYMQAAVADYVKRISKYASVNTAEVQESQESSEARRIEKEGEALLKRIPQSGCLIALDLHGKKMSSEQFAEYINARAVDGCSDITFVIGGPDGIAQSVTSRADLRLSLSDMTFTHRLARLILSEQLYRAMKINNGEQYHK